MPTDEEEFGAETEEPVSNEEISPTGEIIRVRTPRGREVLGILDQRLGASRMKVRCMDGKTRVCRVPGRLKRRLWLREGDIVLVEPWEFQCDEKGDVLYKYSKAAVQWLQRRGFLKTAQTEF
ncbi:translation initiation factor eIF-1A [Candidatus Pacearchaeota archaeon CG06_land_8_20_14_3_00_35_12]|nr:MAG: translation initiation factor eIF-1A [Candidatus Pacearchaeota archaeon CG06_land_8_20_14_3_00_35_12]